MTGQCKSSRPGERPEGRLHSLTLKGRLCGLPDGSRLRGQPQLQAGRVGKGDGTGLFANERFRLSRR